MPNYKIAHLREQGQDMIIIPLDNSFEDKTEKDQKATIASLQIRAQQAGLAGIVVPVWEGNGGRMKFIAPQQWHPYFESLSLAFVQMNLNKQLSW
jgi:hypothetical protein